MRIWNLIFALCGLLATGAGATPLAGGDELLGRLLIVRVAGLPDDTARAICDLGPGLEQLRLQREGDAWVGSFALLHGLADSIARPQVSCYDPRGTERALDGVKVLLTSSTFDEGGLAKVLADRTVRFVFEPRVSPDSIWLLTRDGAVAPDLEGQTFVLPFGLAPLAVSGIAATAPTGRTVVIEADWTEADVATMEEEL